MANLRGGRWLFELSFTVNGSSPVSGWSAFRGLLLLFIFFSRKGFVLIVSYL